MQVVIKDSTIFATHEDYQDLTGLYEGVSIQTLTHADYMVKKAALPEGESFIGQDASILG